LASKYENEEDALKSFTLPSFVEEIGPSVIDMRQSFNRSSNVGGHTDES